MRMKLVVGLVISLLIFTSCTNDTALQEQEANFEVEKQTLLDKISALETDLSEQGAVQSTLEETISSQLIELETLEEQLMSLEIEKATLEASLAEADAMLNETPTVVSLAEDIMALIESQDFVTLATHIHPVQGLRLTPYPYINLANDVVLTPTEVATFGTSVTVYNWGFYDGSGDPITGTPMDYYSEFIYDENFIAPDMMSWNSPIGSGNMINNMATSYPSADYVEFHFTGFNPSYAGMDWSSLTLVFEQVGPTWYLVGMVHGQWTT